MAGPELDTEGRSPVLWLATLIGLAAGTWFGFLVDDAVGALVGGLSGAALGILLGAVGLWEAPAFIWPLVALVCVAYVLAFLWWW